MNVFKSNFRIILGLYLNNIFMLRYLYEQISKIDYMASLQNFRSPLEHTLSLGQFSVVLLHTNFVSYLLVRLLVTCSCGVGYPKTTKLGYLYDADGISVYQTVKVVQSQKKILNLYDLMSLHSDLHHTNIPNWSVMGYPIAEGLMVHIAHIGGITYDYA